jgi:PKHD-type hydroxylase
MNLSNYFYWNNLFLPEEIKTINSLINKYKDKKEEEHLKSSSATKTSTVYPIKLMYLKDVLKKALEALILNNQDNFGYDIFDWSDEMEVNFNIYEKGQEYQWHKDTGLLKSADVKLTALINLSDKSFKGGELNLLDSIEATPVPELNGVGSMVIFNSFILHKVNPITKGTRKTLTIFIRGPSFK